MEADEMDEDLKEYTIAESMYQEKFGRSLIIDAIALYNYPDLQAEIKKNPVLKEFVKKEMHKFKAVCLDYMQSFIEDMPENNEV